MSRKPVVLNLRTPDFLTSPHSSSLLSAAFKKKYRIYRNPMAISSSPSGKFRWISWLSAELNRSIMYSIIPTANSQKPTASNLLFMRLR